MRDRPCFLFIGLKSCGSVRTLDDGEKDFLPLFARSGLENRAKRFGQTAISADNSANVFPVRSHFDDHGHLSFFDLNREILGMIDHRLEQRLHSGFDEFDNIDRGHDQLPPFGNFNQVFFTCLRTDENNSIFSQFCQQMFWI